MGMLECLLPGKAETELAASSKLWKLFCAIWSGFIKGVTSQQPPPQLFRSAVHRGRPAY